MLWACALCCSPACVRSSMQTTRSRSPIHPLPARMTYGYPGTAYTCWACERVDSSFYSLTTRPIAPKPAAWRLLQLLRVDFASAACMASPFSREKRPQPLRTCSRTIPRSRCLLWAHQKRSLIIAVALLPCSAGSGLVWVNTLSP